MAAAVVGGTVLAGCGAEECTTEADCAGYACVFEDGSETGTCAESCMGNAECATGYVCQIEAGETEGACFAATSGCTADSQCGAYTCNTGSGQCNTACTDGSECSEGYQCDAASSACQMVAADPYIYAAVTSEVAPGSDDSEGPNPGPDIDAIVLVAGGTEIPAAAVATSAPGGDDGENMRTVVNDVLGARSAMTGAGPIFECSTETGSGYFSMGDNVGFLVVSFGAGNEIADGDTVMVYELDETNCTDGISDRAESYSLYIGQDAAQATSAAAVRDGWCQVGAVLAGGGTFTGIVDLDRCN